MLILCLKTCLKTQFSNYFRNDETSNDNGMMHPVYSGREYKKWAGYTFWRRYAKTPYIGTEYIGQAVAVTKRLHSTIFDVILDRTVLKSFAIQGLHNQMIPLDGYISLICQEAESEYRQYLASKRRYV